MPNYLDKVLHLYPTIQHVMYWQTRYDGTPWENPYHGLVWENEKIEKPSQEMLDALNEDEVLKSNEVRQKKHRDASHTMNLQIVAAFQAAQRLNKKLTFSQYLDELEEFQKSLNEQHA